MTIEAISDFRESGFWNTSRDRSQTDKVEGFTKEVDVEIGSVDNSLGRFSLEGIK